MKPILITIIFLKILIHSTVFAELENVNGDQVSISVPLNAVSRIEKKRNRMDPKTKLFKTRKGQKVYTECEHIMNWEIYNRLGVIYTWLDCLSRKYHGIFKLFTLGISSENPDIRLVKISKGGFNNGKPRIYIDGGIHRKERIGVSTATIIINELLNFSRKNKKILTDIVWIFVPVLNPDGYEYSLTKDPNWRKTRSRYNGDECIGVDANRNFDFHWNESGVEPNPCSIHYPGPYPFSEPEVNATRNFIYQHKNVIKVYLTFHCCAQHLLTPWGYTTDLPNDYNELKALGDRAINALKSVRGTEYEVGSSAKINLLSSGGSRDWARGIAKIKYPFLIELTGKPGSVPPSSEIISTGEEIWEAVKVIAKHILKKYPYEK